MDISNKTKQACIKKTFAKLPRFEGYKLAFVNALIDTYRPVNKMYTRKVEQLYMWFMWFAKFC